MKKLLALVLSLVMVMGLATVSTNAAYTDSDKISHEQAVEVLSAVGIINGRTDGSFDPEGSVTRAEMAKMITILKLGDVDVSAFKGTSTDLTDINGHWAEAYIKYCYSQGVISGRGNGIFDPNANVTTAEAAKMLLVILGYNADVQGYTGSKWAINVTRDAQLKGFFDELSSLTSDKKLNRDEAAQLMYNCATAIRVVESKEIDTNGVVTTAYTDADRINGIMGTKDEKLLGKTFDAYEKETYLNEVEYDRDKKEFTYKFVSAGLKYGEDLTGDMALNTNNNNQGNLANVKSTEDYSDLFAQKVKVVWKHDTKKSENTLLGLYGEGKVLATTIMGEVTNKDDKTDAANKIAATDKKVCLDGKSFSLDEEAQKTYVVASDAAIMTESFGVNNKINTVKVAMDGAQANYPFGISAIDNDNDGNVDVFVVTALDVFKVTYAGASTLVAERILANGGNQAGKSFSKDSDTGVWSWDASGTALNKTYVDLPSLAKDDLFVITYGVKDVTAKAEKLSTFEGKVTGEKKYNQATATNTHSVQVDGTWYTDLQYSAKATFGDQFLDNTYTFVSVNGYLYYADEVTSGSKDVLLTVGTGVKDTDGVRIKVMFTDGTEQVVTVTKYNDVKWNNPGFTSELAIADSTLYTYSKKSDGYELKKVGDTVSGKEVLAGNDKFLIGQFFKKDDNKAANISGYSIDDKAVVFVKDVKGDYSAITGERLKALKITTAINGVDYLIKGSTVKVAYVETGDRAGADTFYAYATGASYSTKYKDDDSNFAKVWTADGLKEIYVDQPLAKHGVYELKELSDGSYEVENGGAIVGTLAAITEYNTSDKSLTAIKATGAQTTAGSYKYYVGTEKVADNYKITSDTVVLNVNKDDAKGIEGTAINEATRDQNNSVYSNAWIVMGENGTTDKTDEIKLIVYDVRNDWSGYLNDDDDATLGDFRGVKLANNKGDLVAMLTPVTKVTDAALYSNESDVYFVAGDTFSVKVVYTAAPDGTLTLTAPTQVEGVGMTAGATTLTAGTDAETVVTLKANGVVGDGTFGTALATEFTVD